MAEDGTPKTCPIRDLAAVIWEAAPGNGIDGAARQCERERCAWWVARHNACAIAGNAAAAESIAIGLEMLRAQMAEHASYPLQVQMRKD
jgi:hypothetical protein